MRGNQRTDTAAKERKEEGRVAVGVIGNVRQELKASDN